MATQGNRILYTDYDTVMNKVLNFRRTVGLDTDSGVTQRNRVLPHNPIFLGSQNYLTLADTVNELNAAAENTTSAVNPGCSTYYAGHHGTKESNQHTSHYTYYSGYLNTNRNPYYSGHNGSHYSYHTGYLTTNRSPYYSARNDANYSYHTGYLTTNRTPYYSAYNTGNYAYNNGHYAHKSGQNSAINGGHYAYNSNHLSTNRSPYYSSYNSTHDTYHGNHYGTFQSGANTSVYSNCSGNKSSQNING